MKPRELMFACLAAAMVACTQGSPVPEDPLEGAWRLIAMHLVSADADSVEVPVHESLFIFADGYVSIAYAFGDRGSVPYAERWHPSDTEKAARFSSLIVNAGSYRLSGTQLEARPLFALAPEFVGGKGVFSYSFTGDTLELTWQRSIAFDGLEYPSAGTVTLLRLLRAHPAARLDDEAETRGS
jgi:hypothetical protein